MFCMCDLETVPSFITKILTEIFMQNHVAKGRQQARNRPVYRFNGHRCILWRWLVLDTSGAWRCRLLLLFLLFASFSTRIFLVLLATRLAWRFSASMNASLGHIFSFWSLERRSWDDGWTVSNTGQQLNVLHSLTIALDYINHRTTTQRAPQSHNSSGLYQTQDNNSTCSTVSQWLDCIKHRTTT